MLINHASVLLLSLIVGLSSSCFSMYKLFKIFFFFNDTATTEIYTLSLHDALPICKARQRRHRSHPDRRRHHARTSGRGAPGQDRKSTRLNSSHANISYAVFCLKKKKWRDPYGRNGYSSRTLQRRHPRSKTHTNAGP